MVGCAQRRRQWVGTVALYRLAVARKSVVAPLSAVLSAARSALAGLRLGEHLKVLAWAGIVDLQAGSGIPAKDLQKIFSSAGG